MMVHGLIRDFFVDALAEAVHEAKELLLLPGFVGLAFPVARKKQVHRY